MEDRLRELYVHFNAREADAVLAALSPDVDWPTGWEGGRVHGHAAVRDYWQRQWAAIDPSVEPVGFERRPDGSVAVRVHQVVRDLGGATLADEEVTHVYAFGPDGLVRAMTIEP
jgi:hypothetical protein